VGFGADGVEDLGDGAVCDDVGDALGVAEAVFLACDVVGGGNGAVAVGEEGKGQAEFVGEGFVGGFIVHADAEDGDAFTQVLLVVVAEAAGFFGTARGVVLGVEVENDGFVGVVGEFDGVAVGVLDGEVWGFGADG
jgi:hypothetical protein